MLTLTITSSLLAITINFLEVFLSGRNLCEIPGKNSKISKIEKIGDGKSC